jgi:PBSX family phage terminase large subunit
MSILAQCPGGNLLERPRILEVPSCGITSDDLKARILADCLPAQKIFLEDSHRIVGYIGGFGSGKSWALAAKLILQGLANPGCTLMACEPTFPMIRTVLIPAIDAALDTWDISYKFRSSPQPEYILDLPDGPTTILCQSAENWQRIRGQNIAAAVWDECDTQPTYVAQKAGDMLLARMRSGQLNQLAVGSTPEGFRWAYHTFVENANDSKRLIQVKTADNPHLPASYIDSLRENYPSQLVQAYLEGQFVNLTTGQVYDRFDRAKHVVPTDRTLLDGSQPLRIGVDFNISNMHAVIAVRIADRLIVVDEIKKAHDTDALGQTIRQRYPSHKIYIYPDASGGNRSTNATRTDIQILESYGMSNQSPKSNPDIRDRVSAVQALLENGKGATRLSIDAGCTELIRCLELQAYTDKGVPDKDGGYDHMNDALGYLVWREFNPLHARAGRGTGVRIY